MDVIGQFTDDEDLPCADQNLLAPLRNSREFRAIRTRIVSDQPVDTWLDDGLHFFVFELEPDEHLDYTPIEPAVAVFVMIHGDTKPLSAVAVMPSTDGGDARIDDLRDAEKPWLRRAADKVSSPLTGPLAALRSR